MSIANLCQILVNTNFSTLNMSFSKIVTSSLLLLVLFSVRAQTTLDIIGVSSIDQKPTQTVVTFAISHKSISYEAVLNKLNTDINGLTSSLKKQGFSQAEIVTRQFDISKSRKYTNGSWKEDGYTANQQLKVIFPIDNSRLIKVLKATTGSGSQPDIAIQFTLDSETTKTMKEQLLVAAVEDARKKADLIATTTGQKVTGIVKINYGKGSTASPQPMYAMAEARMASDAASFGPMEAAAISMTDQVQITYQLE